MRHINTGVKKKKEEIMIAWYYIAKMPGEVILV
jgi:hypothetical protein